MNPTQAPGTGRRPRDRVSTVSLCPRPCAWQNAFNLSNTVAVDFGARLSELDASLGNKDGGVLVVATKQRLSRALGLVTRSLSGGATSVQAGVPGWRCADSG